MKRLLLICLGLLFVFSNGLCNKNLQVSAAEFVLDERSARSLSDIIDDFGIQLDIHWYSSIIDKKPIKNIDAFIDFMRDLGWLISSDENIKLKVILPRKKGKIMDYGIKSIFFNQILPYASHVLVSFE